MKRILLVDDEPDLLDTVSDFLGDRYEVTTVTSGAAAVDAFRCRRPDLVFLDVNLPGASGVETLTRLRELDPSVPVVMVNVDMKMEHMALLAAGMSGDRAAWTGS
jgi:DNA-binding response OmpR family regulator